ncbi:abortive infection family protein [Nocardioides sp.]|uniref:abortive infection family protein n=1 Tax=Nocardioides sp. TaxID=35761 RepID=UPI00321C022F
MQPDAFLIYSDEKDSFGLPAGAVGIDLQLLEAVRSGRLEGHSDTDVAIALADLAHEEYMRFGTDGAQKLDNVGSGALLRALVTVAERAGLRDIRFPFRDFDSFKSHWIREGCSGAGGWQARRDLLAGLFDPIHGALRDLERNSRTGPRLTAQALDALTDPAAIRDHLDRIGRTLEADPRAAVGSAKELVESTAKLVITQTGGSYSRSADIQKLTNAAQEALGLAPKQIGAELSHSTGLKSLLGGLLSLGRGLAELRNDAGTGHGQESVPAWVEPRHARMAVGAAHVWCQFVLETLEANAQETRTSRR